MVIEGQSKLTETPKKGNKLIKKIKLTGALFGARVLDAISGENPVIIEKEPKKTVEIVYTSNIDWAIREIEELEKNHKSSTEKNEFIPSMYQEFSEKEKYSNFKNSMKLQSEAEEFKQNSISLKLIRELYNEQKMPRGKTEETEENLSKSLTEENTDLIKYINFLPGKDTLLLYRFMLRQHQENPIFGNLVQTLGKRSKEIELSLKLHQN